MSQSKKLALGETKPLVTPIYQTSVYAIPDLDALDAIMNDGVPGYIYAMVKSRPSSAMSRSEMLFDRNRDAEGPRKEAVHGQ